MISHERLLMIWRQVKQLIRETCIDESVKTAFDISQEEQELFKAFLYGFCAGGLSSEEGAQE